MHFAALILRNVLRRRTRSVLSVAGIAVGVAAVVSLASLAWGFEDVWTKAYTERGTDLVVTKATSESALPATFDQARARELQALPNVVDASGVLADIVSIEDAPTMIVFGWQQGAYVWQHLRLVRGRWPADANEHVVALGTMAREVLKKDVGSKVLVETETFTVCGIFDSDSLLENGAVVLTLPRLQTAMEQPGKINFLNLKMRPGATAEQIEKVKKMVPATWPGFQAFTAGEVARNNTGVQVAKGMSWATSGIALVVGGIGVMNTMLMSVFERFQEIGILLAVGWRRGRVLRMILGESILLGLAGGALGTVVGALAVKVLEYAPLLRGKIQGEFSVSLFLLAAGISVGLGAIGGLYPAFRASRMQPSDALRHD
ncbi:MAG TPA: ABC transporter permease [Candidatus Elarobacter sp.]|jgi:putative ABC transport system permease protein|nr:ABC transporter permease [Candidatus Elarobacter sp.]